jgi:hypothetical protein
VGADSRHSAASPSIDVSRSIRRSRRRRRLAQQLDTLVLAEHRGHRPGMLLKIANLRKPAAEHTGSRAGLHV